MALASFCGNGTPCRETGRSRRGQPEDSSPSVDPSCSHPVTHRDHVTHCVPDCHGRRGCSSPAPRSLVCGSPAFLSPWPSRGRRTGFWERTGLRRVSPCFQQSLDDSSPGRNTQLLGVWRHSPPHRIRHSPHNRSPREQTERLGECWGGAEGCRCYATGPRETKLPAQWPLSFRCHQET